MRLAILPTFAIVLGGPLQAGESPRVSSGFGPRSDPIHGARAVHRGVDLAEPVGTPVVAAAAGIVRVASRRGGYGLLVEVVHPDATTTRYAHLSRILVRPAQYVAQGEPVGEVGTTGRSTGSHLHFEYRIAGVAVDPLPYLGVTPITVEARRPPASAAPPHRSRFAVRRNGEPEAAGTLPGGRQALRRLAH